MPDVYATQQRPAHRQRPHHPGHGHVQHLSRRTSASSAPTIRKTASNSGAFARSRSRASPAAIRWGGLPDLYRAGGESWITGSYDPELNLTYWGTTQAKPWMPASRGMNAERRRALHELDARARREHGQARVVLLARARRSVRPRRRLRARARRLRRREVGVLGRQGRRAVEERPRARAPTSATPRPCSRTSGRSFDRETGPPRYRQDILDQKVGEWIDACPSTAGGKNWHAMSFHAPSRQLIIPLEPELRFAARAVPWSYAGRRQRRRRRPPFLRDARHERQRRQARGLQRGHAGARLVARAARVVPDVGAVDGRRPRIRRRSRSKLQGRRRARRQRGLGNAARDFGARVSRSASRSTASSTSPWRQGSAAAARAVVPATLTPEIQVPERGHALYVFTLPAK